MPTLDDLCETLQMIARMKIFPDDKINRFTLVCAINLAADTLDALKARTENKDTENARRTR